MNSHSTSTSVDTVQGATVGASATVSGPRARAELRGWARSLASAVEPRLYLLVVATFTLVSARVFFDARHSALNFARAAQAALADSNPVKQTPAITWSAPLDDVFIHFDFARSLAQGHFFEWAPGSSYSSGATSWLYPAMLAVAYRVGLTGFWLGYFADWFATLCVFVGLLALRGAFGRAAPFYYLAAATVCFQGLLGFTLWSGMEFALFFGLFCIAQAVYCRMLESDNERLYHSNAWLLGAVLLLLAATRPESLCCGVAWCYFGQTHGSAAHTLRSRVALGARILGPAFTYFGVRALVNFALTGTVADAGSLAKLVFLAPYNDAFDSLWQWLKNVGFQLGRITAYHVGISAVWGSILWVLVLAALWLPGCKRQARLLCAMALLWMLLVASNEYVRYQNDRYSMAPLLWLLLCATLAVDELLSLASRAFFSRANKWQTYLPASSALLCCSVYAHNQLPRFFQQAWLFGRASRNVAEQQVRVGLLLQAASETETHRVLVGDAGAIEYFSQLPSVDAFGLGGPGRLPFAQAVRLGNGATVELIERLQLQRRPDLLALYPSWWKDLPLWFGHSLLDVNIAGNVMCGADSKVVYAAEWRGLGEVPGPTVAHSGWQVVDDMDIADLVSEREHDYSVCRRHSGYVIMKLLPNPQNPAKDIFDAGRILFSGDTATFRVAWPRLDRPLRLVLRAAPHAPMTCQVADSRHRTQRVEFVATDGWVETTIDLDPSPESANEQLTLQAQATECNLFHIWAMQPAR